MNEQLFLVHGRRRTPIKPGALLGEGANGCVYTVMRRAGTAVKLYRTPQLAREHEAKVAAMLASPPDLPPLEANGNRFVQIAWPNAIVVDGEQNFRGFTMPIIESARSTSIVNLLQRSSRRSEGLPEHYGYRVLVARNLAALFHALHRAGHHMIDLKPANLRCYPENGWIAILDTDGFSIGGNVGRFPANMVSDDYIAPESYDEKPETLGRAQDEFALAVIIFQLLNNGVHPFSGSSQPDADLPPDIQTRIAKGLYPYGLTPPADLKLKPALASVHNTFRRDTRALFDRSFAHGTRRPGAEKWRDHVTVLLERLKPCKAHPDTHAHFGGGCGFCQYEGRIAALAAKPRARTPIKVAPANVALQLPNRRLRPSRGQSVSGHASRPRRSRGRAVQPWSRQQKWKVGGAFAALALVIGGTIALASIDFMAQQPIITLPSGAVVKADTDPETLRATYPGSFAPVQRFIVRPNGRQDEVALRSGPGAIFDIIAEVPAAESLSGIVDTSSADDHIWVYVQRDGGSNGYIDRSQLVAVPGDDPMTDDTAMPQASHRPTGVRSDNRL